MSLALQDRRPPRWFIDRVANPLVRRLAPGPLGRHLPVAVLTVTGRRTGRRFTVPVGVHEVDHQRLVFTDAPWRINFRGGALAELLTAGQRSTVNVTLHRPGFDGDIDYPGRDHQNPVSYTHLTLPTICSV